MWTRRAALLAGAALLSGFQENNSGEEQSADFVRRQRLADGQLTEDDPLVQTDRAFKPKTESELIEKAIAEFPYRLVEVAGRDAETKFEELRSAGEGTPVYIGSTDDLLLVTDTFWEFDDGLTPQKTLDRSQNLARLAKLLSPLKRLSPYYAIERGVWPEEASLHKGPSILRDMNGAFHERAFIAVLPTDQAWAAPAYLNWSSPNHGIFPNQHVAQLRNWHARYGAQLVSLGETMELRAERKPATRKEALRLAREHWYYAPDTFGGSMTLEEVAAYLMASDWWSFWWD